MPLSSLSEGGLSWLINEDARVGFNPLAEETLEATWWVLDREPGMDDIMEKAGTSLEKMKEELGIYPFQDRDGNDRLFLAKFEFPKYGEEFQHKEAIFADGEVGGFIDFLAGFPIDCCEMLVAIGERCSKASTVTVKEGGSKVVAPVPDTFFEWPDADKVLFNLTALPIPNLTKIFAENLEGEYKPQKAHWWLRVNLADQDEKKFPVPGEFLGLGVRMMPDKPWGKQLSSPFIWSGQWMDTVYYSSGVVTEVIEPDDDCPYPRYKVKWRVCGESDGDGIIEREVLPTDFAEYRVGSRITILKDVETEKPSQLWKDEDMAKFGETWVIAPLGFYGLDYEEE